MAGPYTPPNPYGNYFSPGMPEATMRQVYGSMPAGFLPPHAMNALGIGAGGANPTPTEYLAQQIRNQYQQQFLADVLRRDPRVNNVTTALLNQMAAPDRQSFLNVLGGRGNLQTAVGFALSQPGLSSLIGGSPYALGQGALAAMSGGLSVGGIGMFSENAAALMASRQLHNALASRFTSPGGRINMQASYGLTADQLAGIAMMGAAQGAFGGMSMGSIVSKGNAMSFQPDKSTIDKIVKFVEAGAKFASGLIDVFGQGNAAELMNKARNITGLSLNRLENADLIHQRLSSLRSTGLSMGIDTATMFKMAEASTAYGKMLGLGETFAGNVSEMAQSRAAQIYRSTRYNGLGFNVPMADQSSIAAGIVRDQAGMLMDPVGRRRAALTLASESGLLPGSAAAEVRRLMREDGPGAIGRMDALMRSSGMDMDSYIRVMGGPSGISDLLSETGKESLRSANASSVVARATKELRQRFGRNLTGPGGQALWELTQGVEADTLDKILQANSGGFNASATERLLAGDPAGLLYRSKYMSQVQAAVTGMGGGRALGMFRTLRQAIGADPFLSSHFMTESARQSVAVNEMAVASFNTDEQRMFGQGMFQGLMDRLTGNDPRSSFVRAVMRYPGAIVGRSGRVFLPEAGSSFNEAQMRETARTLVNDLRGSKEGDRALSQLGLTGESVDLRRLHDQLSNMWERHTAFREFQMADIGGSSVMISRRRIEHMRQWDPTIQAAMAFSKALPNTVQGALLHRGAAIMTNNPEMAEGALKAMLVNLENTQLLSTIPEKELGRIAKLSPRLSGDLGRWLMEETDRLQQKAPDSMPELNQVRRLSNVLSKAGVQPADKEMTTQVITGTLKLIGDSYQMDARVAPSAKGR